MDENGYVNVADLVCGDFYLFVLAFSFYSITFPFDFH